MLEQVFGGGMPFLTPIVMKFSSNHYAVQIQMHTKYNRNAPIINSAQLSTKIINNIN